MPPHTSRESFRDSILGLGDHDYKINIYFLSTDHRKALPEYPLNAYQCRGTKKRRKEEKRTQKTRGGTISRPAPPPHWALQAARKCCFTGTITGRLRPAPQTVIYGLINTGGCSGSGKVFRLMNANGITQ